MRKYKEAEKQFAEQSGTWFSGCCFSQKLLLLIGILFTSLLRRESCQTLRTKKRQNQMRMLKGKVLWEFQLLLISSRTRPQEGWNNEKKSKERKWKGRKFIGIWLFGIIITLFATVRKFTIDPQQWKNYSLLLPTNVRQYMRSKQQPMGKKREEKEKNLIKKFFMWFEYEIFPFASEKAKVKERKMKFLPMRKEKNVFAIYHVCIWIC